ncbi:MAG: ABC transporter ATP-binding protein [Thermodesulfobacteriota bacterium]|nr:ABC transporter ATP-binding protein [Thermodesulfobacteriota bacterium]
MDKNLSTAGIKEYIVKHRGVLLAGLMSLVVVDLLQLFIPRVIKRAVDDLTTLAATRQDMLIYALIILLLAVAMAGFRYAWRRCLIGTSRKIEQDMRSRIVYHLHTLDAAYFDKTSTGDLMARATNDINNIRMATGLGIVALTDAVFLGTAAIGFMAYINVKLTLYSLIPMPFIVVFTKFFSRRMHRMYLNVQGTFSDMTESVRERFAGIRVIKAFDREGAEKAAFEKVSSHYIHQSLNLTRVTGTFFPMMLFFTNISIAIVIYLGGRQTITTVITPGDFVAFISYLNLLTWPMMALGWVTNLIQRGRASFDRINQVLATMPEITEPAEPAGLPDARGCITVEGLSFTYPTASAPSLQNISFSLEAGNTLCLVGPPGSGKTTLTHLIARLYDPDTGVIRMDGIDLRSLKTDHLRKAISFMPQEPFLFSGTIKENITFAEDIAVDDPELTAAADRAGLTETIETLSKGFDTITGERGVVLSGGQKQRVALARALYHDAPVVILDDPISQVDTETADHIMAALKTAARSKTLIIVSHRLSVARFSDQVIVLDQGRILESGSHEDLIKGGGYYERAWKLQQLEEGRHDGS